MHIISAVELKVHISLKPAHSQKLRATWVEVKLLQPFKSFDCVGFDAEHCIEFASLTCKLNDNHAHN